MPGIETAFPRTAGEDAPRSPGGKGHDMTVKKLIARPGELPPDMTVCLWGQH